MIGTYYYPEQWPRDQWERDFKRIKQMGLHHVHMAEFAWVHMEPKEAYYTFKWLDEAVDLAKKAGLSIILCTPTAAPPVWLSSKYPETMMVTASGRRVKHGSRAHRCVNSKTFVCLAEGITLKMAERYGHDPNVIGWQIDNELGHYENAACYCPECHKKFRDYLKTKYQGIDELNLAWAGDFWSQRYEDFEEIELPNSEALSYLPNEHALLDFYSFYSLSLAAFIENQATSLRAHLHKDAWVTHNFIADSRYVYPRHVKEKTLDFFTNTIYPVFGKYDGKPIGELFRIGDPMQIAKHCDFARGHNGRWGVMEMQPGQVNWGPFNCKPHPGAIRLWLWTAIAHGAELLDTYRFKQPLSGCEQYHEGLIALDGKSLSQGGKEFKQVANEIKQLESHWRSDCRMRLRRAAVYFDWVSVKALEIHPQSTAFDPYRCWMRFYEALKTFGYSVDIIDLKSDLRPYELVCTAMVDLVDNTTIDKWEHYLNSGGHLLVGPRTATRLRNGHFPTVNYGGRLAKLINAEMDGYDVLPDGQQRRLRLSAPDKMIKWHIWSEQWRPGSKSILLAVYEDQFYNGACAAFSKPCNKGTVTIIGFDATSGIKECLFESLRSLGKPVKPLPNRCLYHQRGQLGFFLNYNETKINIPDSLIGDNDLVMGEKVVPPVDLSIWRINNRSA